MSYLYGQSDTKYKKRPKKIPLRHGSIHVMSPIKYQEVELLARHPKFDPHQCPIDFRTTPATLVELCIPVVDRLPLPSVFEWTDKDIRLWILRYGYPQYMHTFRVNMIWGRKLLLLDANALSAMNIKNFAHIKHITYGIRMMFHFELTKMSRCLTLPDEKPFELYLLWHTQTGLNYDKVRCTDLLRRMQLLRERYPYYKHWDLLELWLRRERERKYKELIAYLPRNNLFEPKELIPEVVQSKEHLFCSICLPPCDCFWPEKKIEVSHVLCVLKNSNRPHAKAPTTVDSQCTKCIPPCECGWLPRHYLTGTVLTCLMKSFPETFAPGFDSRHGKATPKMMLNWTRFSI